MTVANLSTLAVGHPVAAEQITRQPAVAEFIRVADNHWTFEGAETGQRFVPFGANLVFHDPAGPGQGLDLLVRPDWDPVSLRRLFVAAQQLRLNVLRSSCRVMVCCEIPHHPSIGWMGSAAYRAGTSPCDLDMLDYTTVHVYTNQLDYQPKRPMCNWCEAISRDDQVPRQQPATHDLAADFVQQGGIW